MSDNEFSVNSPKPGEFRINSKPIEPLPDIKLTLPIFFDASNKNNYIQLTTYNKLLAIMKMIEFERYDGYVTSYASIPYGDINKTTLIMRTKTGSFPVRYHKKFSAPIIELNNKLGIINKSICRFHNDKKPQSILERQHELYRAIYARNRAIQLLYQIYDLRPFAAYDGINLFTESKAGLYLTKNLSFDVYKGKEFFNSPEDTFNSLAMDYAANELIIKEWALAKYNLTLGYPGLTWAYYELYNIMNSLKLNIFENIQSDIRYGNKALPNVFSMLNDRLTNLGSIHFSDLVISDMLDEEGRFTRDKFILNMYYEYYTRNLHELANIAIRGL